MSNGLCKFHNMDECAGQYCDFYNNKEKMCALALEAHQKVELLERVNKILDTMDKTGRQVDALKVLESVGNIQRVLH